MNKTLILSLLALLALPSGASAAPTATLCDERNTAICFTPQQADAYETTTVPTDAFGYINAASGAPQVDTTGCPYVWQTRAAWVAAGSPRQSDRCVRVGGSIVSHQFGRLMFPDIPEQDRGRFSPSQTLYYGEHVVEGVVLRTSSISVNGHLTGPTGSHVDQYCLYFTATNGDAAPIPGTALDRTPQSVYVACAFKRRQSDPQVAEPTPQPQTLVVPASAAQCGDVGKVTVRSTRLACASARTIMARYARSLKSPAGWACRMVINDTSRRGSCVRKQSGRAARSTAYGIWRS